MKEDAHYEKAIAWAKKHGFSNIKANIEDYDQPTQFSREGDEQPYIPDISGVKMGTKSYLEIAVKSDNVERKVSKWKLLSTLAAMKSGKLFLLAPRGHKAFTDKITKEHNINATIIAI